MFVKKIVQLMVALFALSFINGAAQAAENYTARPIAKTERCPVCGMYPAQFPQWHAQIVFKDGAHTSFDSAAEMFRFLDDMSKYDKKHGASDIAKIFVPAYDKGSWLDAKRAFFVAGSKIQGPMGSDLPAFSSKDEALRFSQKSGGKALSFEQITAAVISEAEHAHSH